MSEIDPQLSERKREHMELALRPESAGAIDAGWSDVILLHNCLPEVNFDDIDMSARFLGRVLQVPIWISGMTGGHGGAEVINRRLARAAERYGMAMGLGSQRAALADESLLRTYTSAREAAPSAVLVANIGAPQLVRQNRHDGLTVQQIAGLVDSIGAQGLAVHLNWAQELMQPEGDRNAVGCLNAIAHVVQEISVPVLVKETGAGVSRRQADLLASIGVTALDVGGAGGTSMIRIEQKRSEKHNPQFDEIARTFDTWGIPTAASVLETRGASLPIVATGGVRTGLDAARALALGASLVGVGGPFLKAAVAGEDALHVAIEKFIAELRTAMFLTGSNCVASIARAEYVLHGKTLAWRQQREV